MSELLIKVGGVFCLALSVFHLFFWQIFHWQEQLAKLSSLNKAVVLALNTSLTLMFVMVACISLFFTQEVLNTNLGCFFLLSIAFLFFARAIQQVVFFKLKHWLSKTFFLLFLLGSGLYGIPVLI